MLQNWLVWVGLVLMIPLAGCRKDTASSREEFSGVMTAENGKAYVPIKLPARKGDTVLGAIAAGAEQPAAGERGAGAKEEGGAAEEVKVDDSSAQAVAESLVAIMTSGDFAKLPDVVPADQTESMKEMVKAYGDLAKAARELKLALDEKIPDHNTKSTFFPISQTLGSLVAAELKVQEVKEVNDSEAQAIFAYVPAGGESKTLELQIKKAENAWRIVLPDFTPPPDIAEAAKLDAEKAAAFTDITRRVRSGDLADAAAVEAQLTEVAAGTYKPAEPAEKPQAKEESGEKPQPKPEANAGSEKQPQQPRQREEVDDVYSGPGQLRAR